MVAVVVVVVGLTHKHRGRRLLYSRKSRQVHKTDLRLSSSKASSASSFASTRRNRFRWRKIIWRTTRFMEQGKTQFWETRIGKHSSTGINFLNSACSRSAFRGVSDWLPCPRSYYFPTPPLFHYLTPPTIYSNINAITLYNFFYQKNQFPPPHPPAAQFLYFDTRRPNTWDLHLHSTQSFSFP